MRTPTQRMLSIYMKNADNRFAQIAIGSDMNAFANFDLELGVLGTNANVEYSITPAGDDWYRCTCYNYRVIIILYAQTRAGG